LTRKASCYLIQNSYTFTHQFSVALNYDPKKRMTSALVHSLSENEINELSSGLLSHKNNIALPMLLPSLLLSNRVTSAYNEITEGHRWILQIESETGMLPIWNAENVSSGPTPERQIPTKNRYDTIDFNRVTSDLTSLSYKQAYCEYISNIHLPMINDFDRINRSFVETAPSELKSRLEEVYRRLYIEDEFLRSSLTGTLHRAQYLSKRCQAQVQTVSAAALLLEVSADMALDQIYSLIAQKDNALSVRDNAALKKISEDQKTHRDCRHKR
jgi:hypothetical protein